MPSRNIYKVLIADNYYHVYNRGVNKRTIFKDHQDYAAFLNLLKRYLQLDQEQDIFGRKYLNLHGKLELLTYCLMPNHFHMLIYQYDERALETLMRRIMSSYAVYFNKRYGRVGPLFQSRYKAVLIQETNYLEHISRYIHLNPTNWLTYEYSSLPFYTGNKHANWITPNKILSIFDNNVDEYLRFIADYTDRKQILEIIKQQMVEN